MLRSSGASKGPMPNIAGTAWEPCPPAVVRWCLETAVGRCVDRHPGSSAGRTLTRPQAGRSFASRANITGDCLSALHRPPNTSQRDWQWRTESRAGAREVCQPAKPVGAGDALAMEPKSSGGLPDQVPRSGVRLHVLLRRAIDSCLSSNVGMIEFG